MIMPSQKDRL